LDAEDPTNRSSAPWWEPPAASLTACRTRLFPLVAASSGRRLFGAATSQNWTVEELLPLVLMGRATPLAVVMVRPGSADAVVCLG
jgi:hypothetical protein